ncbi:MAG TPA: HAMP domain-containing sensor histidine kinase [Candidatus Saccharimonadales bacterium]|nr:HAMP domain-containing sensor histidine kinase [Candidatus Saccharimonadales bacterium]
MRQTMFRSATFKLTMWYLGIVMAISLIFSVVLYHVTTGELGRGLHSETQRIYRQFPVFEGNPLLRPGTDYDTGAHRILLRLVGFNILVLIGAGWASYWLARRTLEPIEEAHEQQKRFTADVSHELRTPLTALKMESEVALMNDKNGKKELRAVLASNLEEADKLESLINNLLKLTRLEAGELQQQFSMTDSKTVAEAAIGQIDKAAKEHKIKLKTDLKKVALTGDQESLSQLLVILLDNAIKYGGDGSIVEVYTGQQDGDAVFKVTDHGDGMDAATLDHVFDRFYRGKGESRSKAESDGFGLGLSIAKMIADLHDGVITLESRPGKGTMATFALPLRQQRPEGQHGRIDQQNNK